MKQGRKKTGFTLIELLVVIVILGVLSTIAVGTFRSYFAKARDSDRVATVQTLAMMIKVDSGGIGDCGTYNYTADGNTTTTSDYSCESQGNLQMLLLDNDYVMPEVKNGLEYYYGFVLGETEGENEFFIATGAEEEAAENGQMTVGGEPESIFVDGTGVGIEKGKGCTWEEGGAECSTMAEVSLYMLNSNGAPINMDTVCATYSPGPATACVAAGCSWNLGGCTTTPGPDNQAECETVPFNGTWNGVCSDL